MRSNWMYVLYAFLLAFISIVTKEIVTFIMLGVILVTLQNIHKTLKELLHHQQEKDSL